MVNFQQEAAEHGWGIRVCAEVEDLSITISPSVIASASLGGRNRLAVTPKVTVVGCWWIV